MFIIVHPLKCLESMKKCFYNKTESEKKDLVTKHSHHEHG